MEKIDKQVVDDRAARLQLMAVKSPYTWNQDEFHELAIALGNALKPLAEHINKIFGHIEKEITYIAPQRQSFESLTEWADRLERAGLWDDPDIKWMYQKECLRVVFVSPFQKLYRMVRRVTTKD